MVRRWLRDDQWQRLEPMLPGKAGDPGRTGENNRLFMEAVLWIARTGSPWRDLPAEFGLWNRADAVNISGHHRQRNITLEADDSMVWAQVQAVDLQCVDRRFHRGVFAPRLDELRGLFDLLGLLR